MLHEHDPSSTDPRGWQHHLVFASTRPETAQPISHIHDQASWRPLHLRHPQQLRGRVLDRPPLRLPPPQLGDVSLPRTRPTDVEPSQRISVTAAPRLRASRVPVAHEIQRRRSPGPGRASSICRRGRGFGSCPFLPVGRHRRINLSHHHRGRDSTESQRCSCQRPPHRSPVASPPGLPTCVPHLVRRWIRHAPTSSARTYGSIRLSHAHPRTGVLMQVTQPGTFRMSPPCRLRRQGVGRLPQARG